MFSNLILQLIVLFLPTQLGLHFWPAFSRTAGIKVDYLSPTLYFVDILLIIYIFANLHSILLWLKKHIRYTALFVLFAFFNIIIAISPLNSLFWWLRIVLYLLFFLTLRLNKVTFKHIRKTLLLSTIIVIMIQITQLIAQSSIGGVFYWLGERTFSTSTRGLAKLALFGREFVRPPSTFSHPNSLAGYLLVVLYVFTIHKVAIWQKLIVLTGLILTFSKAAILALILVTVFRQQYIFLIYLFLGLSFMQMFITPITTIQFISDRIFLLAPIKKIILENPLGVGLGNFIPVLAHNLPGSFLIPNKLQPVHNTPLLALTEIGLPGITLIAWATNNNLKKILKPTILGLIALIIIAGTFDHYWWTLPQNKLILLLAWAVLL